MKIWQASDGVGVANLNTAPPFDAVVDAAVGTASGIIYPTIGAALAAGAKSILVRYGAYSENVTVNSNHVRLIGERPPSTANVPRILGTLTITGCNYVEVGNLLLYQPAGGVSIAAGSHLHVHDVWVYQGTTGQGFSLAPANGNARWLLERCFAWGDGASQNGFLMTKAAASAEERDDITLLNCRSFYQGGNGFFIEGDDTELYSGLRTYTLINCVAKYNARAWDAHGFVIGRRPHVTMIGCRSSYQGVAGTTDGACGVYVNVSDSGATRSARILGGWFYGNRNFGLGLSAASSRVGLYGCHSHGNITADWNNVSSCPGYAGNGLTAPGTNITG